MYGVFAPDADALREVLDRPRRILGHPYCGYLFYLARSVDGEAVRFLREFSSALDIETGEALAFIVLIDRAVLRGRHDPFGQLQKQRGEPQYRSKSSASPWPRPPQSSDDFLEGTQTIDLAETTLGSQMLTSAVARRFHSIPPEAQYRADPEWSLKFADHIGLHREFLPCILVIDDPQSSDDDRCAVIPLDDPGAAWESLTMAIADYVVQPGTRSFITAIDEVHTAERQLNRAANRKSRALSSLYELERLEHDPGALELAARAGAAQFWRGVQILERFPTAATDVLGWAGGLDDLDRQIIASAAERVSADHAGQTTLTRLLESPDDVSSARAIRRTVRRLRNTWLSNPTPENPHIVKMIAEELALAQTHLTRSSKLERRPTDLTRAPDRRGYLYRLEKCSPFSDRELMNCFNYVDRFVRPQVLGTVRDEQIAIMQEELVAAERSLRSATDSLDSARSILGATPMVPFVPYVAGVLSSTPSNPDVTSHNGPSRTAIAIGGTAFVANVVQILQGFGVLR